MDIQTLRIYLDLADSLHFAQTSERQHLSPSTLSRQIARLEQQVGSVLFERNNRSVRLTPAGSEFRRYALTCLQAWEALQINLHQQSEELKGEISLFCSVTASHGLLAGILGRLRMRHTHLDIKLHTGDQAESLQHLRAGLEDMVIAAKPADLSSKIVFQSLRRSKMQFIVSRRSALIDRCIDDCAGDLTSMDWTKVPLIIAEAGLARKHVENWLRTHRLKPDIYAQVTGHEAIVSMVALGCGIAAVPELVLEESPVRDSIRVIECSPELPDFDIGLCTLKQRLDEPLIKAVWDAARE